MKKLFTTLACALFACMAIVACGGGTAHAALPEVVVNTTGTVVYGTHSALMIKKDTATARVAVLYSSGWQYVADDAAWSKYTKLVAGMGARGLLVDGDPAATVISVADSNGIYCQSSQSLIAFPNAPAVALSDGCNFWVKAKANAN